MTYFRCCLTSGRQIRYPRRGFDFYFDLFLFVCFFKSRRECTLVYENGIRRLRLSGWSFSRAKLRCPEGVAEEGRTRRVTSEPDAGTSLIRPPKKFGAVAFLRKLPDCVSGERSGTAGGGERESGRHGQADGAVEQAGNRSTTKLSYS